MTVKIFKRCILAAACAAAAVLALAPAHAGPIVGAMNAVVNVGGLGIGSVQNTRNQNGLLTGQGYFSGSTNYNTYIAGNPQHSNLTAGNEWFTSVAAAATYSITYDLGSLMNIDAFALWNEDFAGATLISLFASSTNLPSSFVSVFTNAAAPNNPDNVTYGPTSYGFAAVNARYFRVEGSNCALGPAVIADFCGVGEVAWRQVSASAVPEPTGLALFGAALVGLGATTRRRSKTGSMPLRIERAPAGLLT